MKKNLIFRVAKAGVMLMITTNLHAQSMSKEDTPDIKSVPVSVSSRVYDDYATLVGIKEKNEKIFSHFTKAFKNAKNISSTEIKGSMMIHCHIDGNVHRILYNKNGKWIQTIKYFDSEKLSDEMRTEVILSYPLYTIFGVVTQVTIGDATAYLIMIENKKSWKIVRLVNDELDVYRSYTK